MKHRMRDQLARMSLPVILMVLSAQTVLAQGAVFTFQGQV